MTSQNFVEPTMEQYRQALFKELERAEDLNDNFSTPYLQDKVDRLRARLNISDE